jgi:hypothetical protein
MIIFRKTDFSKKIKYLYNILHNQILRNMNYIGYFQIISM